MALPANIRINVRAPFPALVTGSGAVTVTKANGIWTIGLNPALLVLQNPPINFGSDQVFVWDPIAKTLILTPIAGVIVPTTRQQRSITAAGNLPLVSTDSILNINAATDLAPIVPAASTRNGAPFTFKNFLGSHLQTLTPTGANKFDGAANYPLGPGAEVTLTPYNDGVNNALGYFVG